MPARIAARALLLLCSLLVTAESGAQSGGAPTAATALPPGRLELAPTTWPIFHANTYATAASPHRGPGPVRTVQSVESLTDRRWRRPSVSPWSVVAEPYADGSQAVLTTPNDGVAKYLVHGERFDAVHFLPLDRSTRDFDWGILLLRGGVGIVTERRHNRFVLFGDRDRDPRAPLEVKGRIPVDASRHGALTAHFSLAPDGRLIALTDRSRLLAVDLRRAEVIATFDLPRSAGTSFHNSFPIDETGRIFLAAQSTMLAVDWDGRAFRLAWSANYDMRGPGCDADDGSRRRIREALAVARGARCTGTGTTPTLIGTPSDGVVVIVDGHAPRNNLVAFWRGAIPKDWTPVRDPTQRRPVLDARVAGVFALPYSTPEGDGHTAENSPAALDHAIVVAQWAGFRPTASAPRGVQRVDWNRATRRFELVWANPSVHFNGVPTIACTSGADCHAYGMGRYPSGYVYTSLDFATGRITGRLDLGADDAVLDQGNNHAVTADGSIVYAGKARLLRIR